MDVTLVARLECPDRARFARRDMWLTHLPVCGDYVRAHVRGSLRVVRRTFHDTPPHVVLGCGDVSATSDSVEFAKCWYEVDPITLAWVGPDPDLTETWTVYAPWSKPWARGVRAARVIDHAETKRLVELKLDAPTERVLHLVVEEKFRDHRVLDNPDVPLSAEILAWADKLAPAYLR